MFLWPQVHDSLLHRSRSPFPHHFSDSPLTLPPLGLQVRDSLLHPQTVERLQGVRRWVEQPDGEFPPSPLDKDVPLPLYGVVRDHKHNPSLLGSA